MSDNELIKKNKQIEELQKIIVKNEEIITISSYLFMYSSILHIRTGVESNIEF